MLFFSDFIQVYVFTTNHHLKSKLHVNHIENSKIGGKSTL